MTAGRGAQLAATLDAADEQADAAGAEYDRLPYDQKQAWLDPGGRRYEADRARQRAADAYWDYHERGDATADEMAEFTRRTGRPPRRDDAPGKVRALVGAAKAEALDREATDLTALLDGIVTGLGHDPHDPAVAELMDRELDRWRAETRKGNA